MQFKKIVMEARLKILIDNPELMKKWNLIQSQERHATALAMHGDLEAKKFVDDYTLKQILGLQAEIEKRIRIYRYYDEGTKKYFSFEESSLEEASKQIGTLHCRLFSISKLKYEN